MVHPSVQPARGAGLRLRERQAELRACLTAFRAAGDGAGSVVVVRGPAGAGKTRLLAAAARVARSEGLRTLHATGAELEHELPFGVALDLLGPAAAGVLDAPSDQAVAVRALYDVVAALAAEGPLVLLVDDLHWVDDPSLRLLAYLARRVRTLPVVLVVATRPASPARAPGPADELVRTPGALVLQPAPLSREAIADVLGEQVGSAPEEDVVAACAESTGGNPLLVSELVRVIHAEGLSDAAAIRRVGPQAVAWSTRMTLRGMGDAAVALAQALAVLETAEDVEVVLALAGVTEADARSVLGELEHAEVIGPDRPLRLVHPLVRQALIEDLPETTLGLMRRTAAQLLRDRGRVGPAAAQLLAAPPGGADWAVGVLVAAAEQASEHGAPAEAARLLERALAEDLTPSPSRGAVLARLAHARAAAGDPAAPAAFEDAIAAAGDADARARLLLALAWLHQGGGRFAEAVDASRRGLDERPADDRLATELAAMHDAAVHWSPADDPAAAHVLRSRPVDPADVQAARVAMADEARRRVFAGDEHFEPAVELALRAWDGGAILAASTADDPALVRILLTLHAADRLEDAVTVSDACHADAQRRGLAVAEVTWVHTRGLVRHHQGRLDDSLRDLIYAMDAAVNGWGAWLPVTAAGLVSVHLLRGDADAAQGVLDAADAAGTHPAESPMWTIAQAARGRLALARGENSVAVRHLLEAGRRAETEMSTLNPALGPWRQDAVLALRSMRRLDEARAHAQAELAGARRWGAPRTLAAALRVTAAVTDDEAARLALLEEALTIVAPSEARIEHADTVLALGSELRRRGETRARARLREAIELAESCGAPSLSAAAQRQLLAAGGRLRRRPREGREALTPGERRVARLAAAGLSSREIAEELVVTPKAVAFHLGNAYRKLGISGRRELPEDL